jgi:hypothetical protein
MEGFLMPTNPESIRFARNWSDSPHIPLDDVSAEYESGMFARYLARRFSPALIADAWNTSAPLQEPFEILDSLIAAKQPNLKSIKPRNLCPIFRDYCVHSYFVWDCGSVGFAADVYIRFGNRAVAESVRPVPGSPVVIEDKNGVDHLSCHYYRVWVRDGVTSVKVDLDTKAPEAFADVALITTDTTRNSAQPANPSTVIPILDPHRVDANCFWCK